MPATTPNMGLPYPLLADAADIEQAVKPLADALDSLRVGFIVGEVRFIAVSAPPTGWLLADGRNVSRTTYVLLWNAIRAGHAGTAGDPAPFGNGDGTTTFTLPDLSGRVPVGAGAAAGGGVEASPPNRVVGTKWGVNAVVLSLAQVPVHNHGGATAGGTTGPENAVHTHAVSDPGHSH